MLFSSTIFIFVFLPLVLLGYYVLLRGHTARNVLLLAASLVFYAWGEPVYVFLMLLSIAANFGFGLAVERAGKKKLWLALAVLFNLGVLFHFKYLGFAVENLNALLGTSFAVRAPILPIGISFFTFQAMSYVIDVYRGTAAVQRNALKLGLYISFFPQLIAGPIVRYNSIAEQIDRRSVTPEGFQEGVCRFIRGLGKKILLANNLALAAETGFSLAATGEISSAMAWLGSLAYTLQLYFDFSGYSDMAIGLGAMFGFRFEENFNYPYISRSFTEFWNRWHISLGRWFRDYVYFPMGGSRVSKPRLALNLLVVWLLTGIWHGAAWQYIVWGTLFGLLVGMEKFTNFPRGCKSRPVRALYTAAALLIIHASMVVFGSKGIPAALTQLRAMLLINPAYDPTAAFYWNETRGALLLALLFATPAWPWAEKKLPQGTAGQILRTAVYTLVFVVSVSYLAMGSHNPFIYFNF